MQMVATSKMKKAQENAKAGRPYALLLADIILSIADEFEVTQSYFVQRPVKHRGILVIGTDKGLCRRSIQTFQGARWRGTRKFVSVGLQLPSIFPQQKRSLG